MTDIKSIFLNKFQKKALLKGLSEFDILHLSLNINQLSGANYSFIYKHEGQIYARKIFYCSVDGVNEAPELGEFIYITKLFLQNHINSLDAIFNEEFPNDIKNLIRLNQTIFHRLNLESFCYANILGSQEENLSNLSKILDINVPSKELIQSKSTREFYYSILDTMGFNEKAIMDSINNANPEADYDLIDSTF